MCVADNKPGDPPEKRAWAIYHNAETVAAQAREAEAVARADRQAAYAGHEGQFPSAKEQSTSDWALQVAIDSRVAAERAAQVALEGFIKLRTLLGLADFDIQGWSVEHKRQATANRTDHR